MNLNDIDALWGQIGRLLARVGKKDGHSQEWIATLSDGRSQKYVLNGLRSLQELEDDVRVGFRLLWDYRDYLVKSACEAGHDRDGVFARVNREPLLMLCADIANKLKHERLIRPKTALMPF